MSSQNKTANLGLNLWEAEDKPKRQDFCEDNQKIDAALSSHTEKLDGHITNAGIHVTSEQKETMGKRPTIVTYKGQGRMQRIITLPERPAFVIVFAASLPPTNYGPHETLKTGEGTNFFFGFASQQASSFGLTLQARTLTIEENVTGTLQKGAYKHFDMAGQDYVILIIPE